MGEPIPIIQNSEQNGCPWSVDELELELEDDLSLNLSGKLSKEENKQIRFFDLENSVHSGKQYKMALERGKDSIFLSKNSVHSGSNKNMALQRGKDSIFWSKSPVRSPNQ